jgi:DNA-binding NarL/FixJ family response regulator
VSETRILLFGSQRALAQSLAERLDAESDLEVVGTASSPPQARASFGWLRAEIALVDTEHGDVGVDTIRSLVAVEDGPRVVVLAAEDSEDLVPLVLAGVSGWVDKSAGIDQLLAAIRGVARGETWISPRQLGRVVESFRRSAEWSAADRDGLRALTERERDVLACMVAGRSRAQIAAELVLSENTVRTHAQHVLRKLGVHSSLAAVALARRAGLQGRPAPAAAVNDGYAR